MRQYNKIGKFQMESSVMRISDPMYAPDVWCATTLDNCATGTWTAAVGMQDEGALGNRVAILFARHSKGPKLEEADRLYISEEGEQNYINWPRTWKKVGAEIGVDKIAAAHSLLLQCAKSRLRRLRTCMALQSAKSRCYATVADFVRPSAIC